MTFDERLSITTPEGLEIEMNLAGLGSRMAAAIVDSVLLGLLLLLSAFGLYGLGTLIESPLLTAGIGALTTSILAVGYFVAFEVLRDGRTPGKSVFSLRVVSLDGSPVGFGASMVRNLLRFVDLFPVFPVLGPISILASDRNQRIGDLAGRTVVVRDQRRGPDTADDAVPALEATAAAWDVSAVGGTDLELARRYLARRASLTPAKRAEIGSDVAGRLRRLVPGASGSDEWLIEQVVAAKLSRSRP